MKQFISFFLGLIFVLSSFQIFAQSKMEGEYEGVLKVPGLNLDMNISLQLEGATWQGDLDIPKQSIKNMALSELEVSADSISFKLPEVPGNAHYSGAFRNGEIQGTFKQSGATLELNFTMLEEAPDYTLYAQRITRLTDSILPIANVAGLGLGVIMKDQEVISTGFGYRDLESQEKVDENTLFAIGSTTKAFTAAGIAKLVSEGKVNWDEPIRTYIPEFELHDKYATEKMNSIDILCHRSGLPRHDLLWYGTPFTREELLAKLKHAKPNKSFRETWQYQNLMFMTAGILIEKISSKSWESFTTDEFLDPLGMDRTQFSVEQSQKDANAALPYRYDEEDESQVLMDYRNIDEIGPAGSINSSAADMLKWIQFQLNHGKIDDEEIISASDFTEMHNPAMIMSRSARFDHRSPRTYGLGWMIYHYRGLKIVEHGGNIDGFSAHVLLVPEKQLGMVLLANRNGTPLPPMLAYEIVDIMLDQDSGGYLEAVYSEDEKEEDDEEEESDEPEDNRVSDTKPSKSLEEYAGTYSHDAYGDIKVDLVDEALMGKYYSLDIPLTHFHFDVFEGELIGLDETTKIQFNMDFNGEIVSLSTIMEPSMDPIVFDKKGNEKFTERSYLESFLGEYTTEDLIIKIELKGDILFISPVGQPSFELMPMTKNKFKPKELPGYSIEFIEEDGKITEAKLNQPNGVFRAQKTK